MTLAATRTAHLLVVPLLTAALAGCGAVDEIGIREQTQYWYGAGEGASTDVGDIGVRNALVVTPPNGGPATVLATLVNSAEEDDELVEVRVGPESATLDGPLTVPAGGTAGLGTTGGVGALVNESPASPGHYVDLVFVFSRGGQVNVRAIVQEAVGPYAGFGPSVPATASPTPTVAEPETPETDADTDANTGTDTPGH